MSLWPFPARAAGAPPAGPTIESLAKEMPHRKGVLWAVESCKMVRSKTTPIDQQASSAAEAWVKDPTPANHAAATAAAKKTDYQGPGAWAAQAVAWAHPTGAAPGAAPAAVPQAGGASPKAAGATNAKTVSPSPSGGHQSTEVATTALVSVAVAGAVSLAAALSAGAKSPAPQQGAGPSAPGQPTAPGVPKMPAMPAAPQAPPPPSPAELTKIAKVQKPFIELGQKILLDKTPL